MRQHCMQKRHYQRARKRPDALQAMGRPTQVVCLTLLYVLHSLSSLHHNTRAIGSWVAGITRVHSKHIEDISEVESHRFNGHLHLQEGGLHSSMA